MMISLVSYIKELLKERNKLLSDINKFENDNIKNSNLKIDPSPEVIYQCDLMYLGELCKTYFRKI